MRRRGDRTRRQHFFWFKFTEAGLLPLRHAGYRRTDSEEWSYVAPTGNPTRIGLVFVGACWSRSDHRPMRTCGQARAGTLREFAWPHPLAPCGVGHPHLMRGGVAWPQAWTAAQVQQQLESVVHEIASGNGARPMRGNARATSPPDMARNFEFCKRACHATSVIARVMAVVLRAPVQALALQVLRRASQWTWGKAPDRARLELLAQRVHQAARCKVGGRVTLEWNGARQLSHGPFSDMQTAPMSSRTAAK